MTRTRRVAVVGGGVAGLALAAALPRSVEVVLHEAQPERARWGSALVLGAWARPALHRLGVLDAVSRAGSPVGAGRLFALDGRPVTRPRDLHLLAVPRPGLLDALTAAVGPGVRVLHDEVLDPADLDADLVVGADGVRSRVRGLVDPGRASRLGTPWVALRGRLDAPPGAAAGEYWGPGLLVGLVPSPGGGHWFTAHRSALGPEPLDVAAVHEEARALARGAGTAVRATLEDATAGLTATRLWVAPPMRRYVRGRYVVVGDAAHAMTPNLGRGAGEALLDAVTLADRVAARGSLAAWQARRLPSTQAARAASSTVMRLALAGPGAGVRDAALRLSPAGAGRPGGTR